MKKLFFAVSALAALSLLAPSAGFAEHVYSNQVGLYLDAGGTGTGTMAVGVPVSVFLVLTKPTDVENGEAPYTSVNAFELTMYFNPPPGASLFKLNEVLPATAVPVGDTAHLADGYLEYIMAMSEDHFGTAESIVLIEFLFMVNVATPFEVTLGPASTFTPSIPDEMVYMSVSPDLRVMNSSGGDHDSVVFTFNVDGGAVPTENESFGSVKALFR